MNVLKEAKELNSHKFCFTQVLMYSTRTHVQETNHEDVTTCSKLRKIKINAIIKLNFGKGNITLLLDIAKSRLDKWSLIFVVSRTKGICN
jgi:hypothetical protein